MSALACVKRSVKRAVASGKKTKTFHLKCFPWNHLRNDVAQIDTPLMEAQTRACFWGAGEQ